MQSFSFALTDGDCSKNYTIKHKLECLKKDKDIYEWAGMNGGHFGFPFSKQEEIEPYRVDYAIPDLDRIIQEYELGKILSKAELESRRGWARAQATPSNIEIIKSLRNEIYNPTVAFFGTSNIEQWTKEIEALNSMDTDFHIENNNEIKNEFAYKAFLLMNNYNKDKGYYIVRMVVAEGKLEELEQKLNGEYLIKTINV